MVQVHQRQLLGTERCTARLNELRILRPLFHIPGIRNALRRLQRHSVMPGFRLEGVAHCLLSAEEKVLRHPDRTLLLKQSKHLNYANV